MDRRILLKIKLKSLVAESRIIRREERRHKGEDNRFIRGEMEAHRNHVVGKEARLTLLAYSFIRGREYRQVEAKAETEPDWKKVLAMVERYGDYDARKGFAAWCDPKKEAAA